MHDNRDRNRASLHSDQRGPDMTRRSGRCTAWRPCERGTLRSFADIFLPSLHLEIRDIAVHEKNEKRWVQLPARPQLDGNRELVRDQTGKIQYATIMRFRDRPTADAFSGAVVTAIQNFELGINGGAS